MRRTARDLVHILGIAAVLLMSAAFCYRVYRHFRWQQIGDQIHETYLSVTAAIRAYERIEGRPPEALSDLVPTYLKERPTCPSVDYATYREIPDNQGWELLIHATSGNRQRIFLSRSTGTFSDDEQQRMLHYYHPTWVVLRAP